MGHALMPFAQVFMLSKLLCYRTLSQRRQGKDCDRNGAGVAQKALTPQHLVSHSWFGEGYAQFCHRNSTSSWKSKIPLLSRQVGTEAPLALQGSGLHWAGGFSRDQAAGLLPCTIKQPFSALYSKEIGICQSL